MMSRVVHSIIAAVLATFLLLFLLANAANTNRLIYNGTEQVYQQTLVRTSVGEISGLIVTRFGINISCYLSVPFAEPPLGVRRFADPVPVKQWKNVYRADRQAPICLQRAYWHNQINSSTMVRELMKMDPAVERYYDAEESEDCLYLSIYSASTSSKPKSMRQVRANKTVLVWIHGGAFINGGIQLPFQDYPTMVAMDPANLVVVAINYRVNVFGFITTGSDHLRGNYGLRDQIVALKWIQKNIANFGGDPRRVVLWGQSAGGVAIGYHMMTKQSGDQLFKRAILESGNPLLPLTFAKSSYRKRAFVEFIRRLNCTETVPKSGTNIEPLTKWIEKNFATKVLPCLRTMPSDQLFEHYRTFASHYPLAFLPNTADRTLFEFDTFWQAIQSGQHYSFSGDLLLGTNEAEGAQYVDFGPLKSFYSFDRIPSNFTKENIIATLTDVLPPKMASMIETMFDVLVDGVADVNNSTQLWQRYVQLVGDMVFVCSDYFFAKSYVNHLVTNVKHHRTSSPPVYYYRFRTKVSRPVKCPKWSTGACHTDELQFVFGNPLLLNTSYPLEEQKLSRRMMASWLQFAHYGHFTPKTDSFIEWKPFIETLGHQKEYPSTQYLQIDMNSVTMKNGFPGERCETLSEPIFDILSSLDDNSLKMIET